MLWRIVNIIQFIIFFLLVFAGSILGILILVFTWNTDLVVRIIAAKLWGPSVFKLMGAKLETIGRENINYSQNAIYVANHESTMDIPAICMAIDVPLYFIAKKELKWVPFMGWYIAFSGHIFIDRSSKEKAQVSLAAAGEKIKKGKNVITFPEGTRTKDGKIHLFKRGSFVIASESDIGVVPVAIQGAREVVPTNSIKMRPGTIKVKIGKPIFHKDFPELSVDEFAAHVRAIVVDMKATMS